LVLLQGINEYPKPGVQIRKETYVKEYNEMTHKDGMPFVPNGIGKDIVANGLLLLVIVALAVFVGPKGPEIPADPAQIISEAKPDYPFLWLLSAAALLPNGSEIALFFVFPLIAMILLFGLPFFCNVGEKHYARRPLSIIVVMLTYLTIGMHTFAGVKGPWSPHMEAWSATPMKPEFVKGRSPLELQGALLFQDKQCRNCHAVGGEGGRRGPDLSAVGSRMDEPELVRQVIQGGGNMPAYGNNLSPQEVKALVSYLVSLRPPNTIPALNPAIPEKMDRVSSGEPQKEAQTGG
jgi:ubiquinol-cytochrome c reductase cytochrome b subunit